jgi:tRNA threonylcarbamoyladenosine biosynthesis protein TsaB
MQPREHPSATGPGRPRRASERLIIRHFKAPSVRILAIETSSKSGSVATLEKGQALRQEELDPALRSARTLSPAIQGVLRATDWTPRDVQLVAVAIGPGSFTGLRLGVMTAKAFAFAVDAQVLGVGTLDTIAARAEIAAPRIAVAIDAQRDEVYAGFFARDDAGDLAEQGAAEIIAIERWLALLEAGMLVTGPALVKLPDRLPQGVAVAPSRTWLPDAATVGRLAAAKFASGARDDVFRLAPVYLRRSAAEEKWAAREK